MTDITTSVISGELYAAPDIIFDGQALPQDTSVASSVFKFGKTLNALELVIAAATEITIAALGTFTITVAWDEAEDGAFADSETVYSVADGVIAAGTELVRYVGNHLTDVYMKITVATTDATATGTLDAVIASVRK